MTNFDKIFSHNSVFLSQNSGMRKSTKILIILTILTLVPSIFIGSYFISAIVPTGSGFSFEFTPLAWVSLGLMVISNILAFILFVRFLKTQKLASSIFFSVFPLTIVYAGFMAYIVGVKDMGGLVAESVRATLNIQATENSYNNLLWAGLATLIYLVALFFVVMFMCRPLSKVVRVTERLGDGRVKDDNVQLGGGKQFKQIENSLNKINYSFKEKENRLKQTNLQAQKDVPKVLVKILGKDGVEQLEFGKQVTREVSVLFCELKSLNNVVKTLSLEENFNYINSYMKVVSPLIKRFNGFVDKYLGDGIFAVFSKPQDAIECAHSILRAISVKNKNQKNLPAIDAKICVNSGNVVFGVFGDGPHKSPTVVSDEVSLLMKIQELNGYIGTNLLISKRTILQLPQNFDFEYRYTGDLVLEDGRNFALFESLNCYSKRKRDKLLKSKNRFEEGVRAYNEHDYETAKECFEIVLKTVADDEVSFVYFNKASEKCGEDSAV